MGGEALHEWMFPTRTFMGLSSRSGGTTGPDDDFVTRSSWKGWWGSNPPYHAPVFVVTHHTRAPIRMEGGTEFRFVTGGIHAAPRLGYRVSEHLPTAAATHDVLTR